MNKKARSMLKKRPFGASAGAKKDRFAPPKKDKGVIILTAALRKKFNSQLTDDDKAFIRRAESSVGGSTMLVGRPRGH